MLQIPNISGFESLITKLNYILKDIYGTIDKLKGVTGTAEVRSNIDLHNNTIDNLAPPKNQSNPVTLNYFQNNPAGEFATPVDIGEANSEGTLSTINRSNHVHKHASGLSWLVTGHSMDTTLDMDSNLISNLATPVSDADAATKLFVTNEAILWAIILG